MLFNKNTAAAPPPQAAASAFIFDCGAAEFETRVLAASMNIPVIVQFWSPRSPACRPLIALMEKLVAAGGGQLLMARVNMDDNPDLAVALRVQSVPTTYAFFQGRPIDAFQGPLPESQMQIFIDRLVQSARAAMPEALDIPLALKEAQDFAWSGDHARAHGLYASILQQDEKNAPAYVGLVRAVIAAGAFDQAKILVEQVPPDIAAKPLFAEARAALELAASSANRSLPSLLQKAQAAPDDFAVYYDLARAQFAARQPEEAMDSLLHILRRDRDWNNGAARALLLKFFEGLGGMHPATLQGRRKLSSLLFS